MIDNCSHAELRRPRSGIDPKDRRADVPRAPPRGITRGRDKKSTTEEESMKELHLDVEELEERIAPSLVGVNPPGQLGAGKPGPPPGQLGQGQPGPPPGHRG